LQNTLRKAWQRHFDDEFLGKGATCGECVEADMEDPRPRYKKRHFDEEFLGKGAACGEWIEADMEDPRP